MKNIIIKGKPELRKRIRRCPNCGCQFYYTNDEIYKVEGFCGFVICPWCLEEIKTTVFDNSINIVPKKRDSDVVTDNEIDGYDHNDEDKYNFAVNLNIKRGI